jgi:hypothetical protein
MHLQRREAWEEALQRDCMNLLEDDEVRGRLSRIPDLFGSAATLGTGQEKQGGP